MDDIGRKIPIARTIPSVSSKSARIDKLEKSEAVMSIPKSMNCSAGLFQEDSVLGSGIIFEAYDFEEATLEKDCRLQILVADLGLTISTLTAVYAMQPIMAIKIVSALLQQA